MMEGMKSTMIYWKTCVNITMYHQYNNNFFKKHKVAAENLRSLDYKYLNLRIKEFRGLLDPLNYYSYGNHLI
jgi:hypothetical protein